MNDYIAGGRFNPMFDGWMHDDALDYLAALAEAEMDAGPTLYRRMETIGAMQPGWWHGYKTHVNVWVKCHKCKVITQVFTAAINGFGETEFDCVDCGELHHIALDRWNA